MLIAIQAKAPNQKAKNLADFIAEYRFEEVIVENLSPDPKLKDLRSFEQILSQD